MRNKEGYCETNGKGAMERQNTNQNVLLLLLNS